MWYLLMAAVCAAVLCLLIVKKRMVYYFYLKLAVGRTTKFLETLENLLTGKGKENPEVLHQIQWIHEQKLKKVTIQSRDGFHIAGHYLEHPRAERVVIMFHGWRGGWDKDNAALAHGLYEKNCSVLLVEQRAHGESGGEYIGFGVRERYDCLQWIRYIREKCKDMPIYLSGVSMGASTVLMTAGGELPPQVKGIIADCGFTSPYEMVKIFGQKFMHMKETKIEKTVDTVNMLCRKKAGYDLREYSTIEAMEHCKVPVFFVHGTADGFVPYEMSVKNYEACRGRKRFLTIEGAAHTKSYLTQPETYMQALTDFFCWRPEPA